MTFSQFLNDAEYRKRYWAGSQLGWRRFDAARPNDGHRALAGLELDGDVNGVITQNVDGLHQRAGSLRVVDLHGTMDRVRCLRCGQLYARTDIAARIVAHEPVARPSLRRSSSAQTAMSRSPRRSGSRSRSAVPAGAR